MAARQTITRIAEARFVHAKVLSGGGEFAMVILRLEPRERGAGIQFSVECSKEHIPVEFWAGVEAGIRETDLQTSWRNLICAYQPSARDGCGNR